MDIKDRLTQFVAYKRLSKRRFQASIGVSSSYMQGITVGMGADVLHRISSTYPELNTDWLLTGNGEMLNPTSVQQTVKGDGNTTVAGNGNNIDNAMFEAIMKELIEQRKMSAKFQEQIDRLLTIIENMQTNQ